MVPTPRPAASYAREAMAEARTSLELDSRNSGLFTVIETVRTLPTIRAVFAHAKIIYVMDGHAEVETDSGTFHLSAGSSLALGRDRWCRVHPLPSVRAWTLYADETFLRSQMNWSLPIKERVQSGVHPREWDGGALVLNPGIAILKKVEPLWR